jgi:LmbE family N-acetylglucosaminyl deacetylase
VHLAARRLQRRAARLAYYEDLPYAFQPGAPEARLERLGHLVTAQAQRIEITAFLDAKVAAINCYDSQISTDYPDLGTDVRAYAEALGQGERAEERIWHMPVPAQSSPPVLTP